MQYSYGVDWNNWDAAAGGKHRVAPTLKAIPLRWKGIATALLASGAFETVIVSEKGHILDRFGLPVRTSCQRNSLSIVADGGL